MPNLQLSFHTTFALKKDDLIKILNVASKPEGLGQDQSILMTETGFGNKKVAPMKSWAQRCGLLAGNFLSDVGKVVWEKDRYLESTNTEWLMHFFLSFGDKGIQPIPLNPDEWGGWPYFVYSFLPLRRRFTLDDLVYFSRQVFTEERQDRLVDNFRIVLRAYTEKKALAQCGFLEMIEEGVYQSGLAAPPPIYLFAYFLARLWERDFPGMDSVVTERLVKHPMGITPALGLSEEQTQEQLNRLQGCGIIDQRRTVPPFQIVRNWSQPHDLLGRAFAD